MHSWWKKLVLALAGIIILAHNLTPHHHHHDSDDSDGFMHFHYIDHAFVTQSHFLRQVPALADIACTPILLIIPGAPTLPSPERTATPANESPPPLATVQKPSFRGPPAA
jgi:hypothetical protein